MDKLLVIVGPTAVGKSALGVEVALRCKGEVISGDSMQVYRHLDIGTAKIKPEEARGVPHHLIDIKDPDETFSVAEFQILARQHITEINKRGRLPILLGGTGLYIQAVLDEYEFAPQKEDRGYRQELRNLAAVKGDSWLHSRLERVDPQAAEKLHPHDVRRIIRALEYYHCTGRPISANRSAGSPIGPKRYETAIIGLTMERPVLYRRIEERVDHMMEQGFLEEVKKLLALGCRPDHQSMQGLGYKQLVSCLRGEITLDMAVEMIKRDTRRFAKRQLTWFRRDPRINWLRIDRYNDRTTLLREILSIIGRTINISVE